MTNKLIPKYSLSDIQIQVGDHEFQKGIKLYSSDSVKNITQEWNGWHAEVKGSKPHQWYDVSVEARGIDYGHCTCYLGQRDELCKHMNALAIALVHKYRPDSTEQITIPLDQAVCSGQIRDITPEEVQKIKNVITVSLRNIKPYTGPSRIWFQYQDKLTMGSRLVLLALSELPICKESVDIIINLLKRLDRKLLNGVDDSDGTVGDTMYQIVELLNLFADIHPPIAPYIKKKLPHGEVFDWESTFNILA